jgi:hypothetical protein
MILHTKAVPSNIEELDKLNSEIIESVSLFKNDTGNKFYTSF